MYLCIYGWGARWKPERNSKGLCTDQAAEGGGGGGGDAQCFTEDGHVGLGGSRNRTRRRMRRRRRRCDAHRGGNGPGARHGRGGGGRLTPAFRARAYVCLQRCRRHRRQNTRRETKEAACYGYMQGFTFTYIDM